MRVQLPLQLATWWRPLVAIGLIYLTGTDHCLLVGCKTRAGHEPVSLYPERSLAKWQTDNEQLNRWLVKHQHDLLPAPNSTNRGQLLLDRALEKLQRIGLTDKGLERALLVFNELAQTSVCTRRTWDLFYHVRATAETGKRLADKGPLRELASEAKRRAAPKCEPMVVKMFQSSCEEFQEELDDPSVRALLAAIWNPRLLNDRPRGRQVDVQQVAQDLAGLGRGYELSERQLQMVLQETFKHDSRYEQLVRNIGISGQPVGPAHFEPLYNERLLNPCHLLMAAMDETHQRCKTLMVAEAGPGRDPGELVGFWLRQPRELVRTMFVTEVCQHLRTHEEMLIDHPAIFDGFPWVGLNG